MFGMATIRLGIDPHSSFFLSHILCLQLNLIMAALRNRCGHYIFALWFNSFYLFIPHLISAVEIGCLPYFDTWCGTSANLECRSEMCCKRLAANAGPKKVASSGRQTNFAALNKGRHLHSAGRPSRWALAYILVMVAHME